LSSNRRRARAERGRKRGARIAVGGRDAERALQRRQHLIALRQRGQIEPRRLRCRIGGAQVPGRGKRERERCLADAAGADQRDAAGVIERRAETRKVGIPAEQLRRCALRTWQRR
jgi:hypothetical protein